MEACIILGILASTAGRSLVKALKHLMGPWRLAQADPHSETAKNASAAFRQVFPGIKSKEAVALYRIQVRNASRLSQLRLGHLCDTSAEAGLPMLPKAWRSIVHLSQHVNRQAVRVFDRGRNIACRSLTSWQRTSRQRLKAWATCTRKRLRSALSGTSVFWHPH